MKNNRAILTVIGEDKVGIIAGVTGVLAQDSVNILDINQTIMADFFTMTCVVDLTPAKKDFKSIQEDLNEVGKKLEVQIQLQHEDVFRFMHRI